VSFKKILLVKPAGRKGLSFAFDLIPLGLEYIASYLRDVVQEVHIVDMELEQRRFSEIINFYQPDVVGISLSATEHNETLRLARIAKKTGITTVVGGYHPTSLPDLMLSYPEIDIVVRGEGEQTMKELIENGTAENVSGASYRKNGAVVHNEERSKIENLDGLPFPARDLRLYPYKSQDRVTDCDVILMSRGCSGLCSFCCEPSMSQGCFRCRSPENVMAEILEMAKYHQNKPVSAIFADPNFIGNPKQVETLCDLLIEHPVNIEFGALVRADYMAKYSDIVKKMCKAGIVKFEMGIESPNLKDLKSTKKGITAKVHKEAVKNIRENGGRAGGTFVIGLPDQTEEEIRYFPSYAKEIGLTGAAFGIATPFPGTDFYKEMSSQGLIFETNWDNFDEMHSVYKAKHLSKAKIEELATFCMAKFWNIDTFIDQERVFQKRTKQKKNLGDFVQERTLNLNFMANNGNDLQKENFDHHIKAFLEAYVDPRVEGYTKEIGMHDVLEMSRFLRILGPQTVQCSLTFDEASVSFVFKTTEKTVEYIRVINGRQNDSTINLDVDLKWLSDPESTRLEKRFISLLSKNMNAAGLWNTFRLFLATGTEILVWTAQKSFSKKTITK
jgi:radical SAM superfamily enzyme YgiQ (UPF0313 family)